MGPRTFLCRVGQGVPDLKSGTCNLGATFVPNFSFSFLESVNSKLMTVAANVYRPCLLYPKEEAQFFLQVTKIFAAEISSPSFASSSPFLDVGA